MFFTTDEDLDGVVFVRGVFALKNLMDYNRNIPNNLINHLKICDSSCDIIIEALNNKNKIDSCIEFLHKNKVFVFSPVFFTKLHHTSSLFEVFKKVYL